MEVDMIKLSPEDHMDIMNILMQNETHPEFTIESQREMPTVSSANPAGPCGKIIDVGGAMMLPPTLMHPSNTTLGSSINPTFNTLTPLAGTSVQESIVHPFQENTMISRIKSGNSLPLPNLSTHALSQYEKRNSMAAMREMIFRIAAMQPIHIDPEAIKPPKRRNVKISKDPQSVAARHRRERISERIRILQRLVPGGTKMDTASMLDEAIHYVKFLKKQVQSLEEAAVHNNKAMGVGFPVVAGTTTSSMSLIGNGNTPPHVKASCQSAQQGWGSSMQIFG